MASKKIITIFGILITYSISLLASDFEGRIVLSKQSLYDTTNYEYTIKGTYVRIDIKNSFAQIIQSLIIDIEEENITALSPNHKLYTVLKKKRHPEDIDKAEYELIKTPNFKLINGYKCFLWHVRNKRFDSDITFWITEIKFDFLPKVVALLSRTNDYSELINYYIQIALDSTFFPILIIDRTLLQEEKSKMMVTNILTEPVSDKAFEIPGDYKLLRY